MRVPKSSPEAVLNHSEDAVSHSKARRGEGDFSPAFSRTVHKDEFRSRGEEPCLCTSSGCLQSCGVPAHIGLLLPYDFATTDELVGSFRNTQSPVLSDSERET